MIRGPRLTCDSRLPRLLLVDRCCATLCGHDPGMLLLRGGGMVAENGGVDLAVLCGLEDGRRMRCGGEVGAG